VKALIALAVAVINGALGGAPMPGTPTRTFTVAQAQARFRAETGLRLVRFGDASTRDVTSLRTKPHETKRFGEFQLFVIRPGAVQRMRRVFTHGVNPDPDGVYWVPDQAGGSIAVKLLRRNMILAWFPQYPTRDLDGRFRRLTDAVHAFAPELRIRLTA
jgi:hypothetical protein